MESDNWIVQNLQSALNTWNDKLNEIWTLLTQDPQSFKGGAIWSVMTNINGALKAIALGFGYFCYGIIKTCGQFYRDEKAGACAESIHPFCVSYREPWYMAWIL